MSEATRCWNTGRPLTTTPTRIGGGWSARYPVERTAGPRAVATRTGLRRLLRSQRPRPSPQPRPPGAARQVRDDARARGGATTAQRARPGWDHAPRLRQATAGAGALPHAGGIYRAATTGTPGMSRRRRQAEQPARQSPLGHRLGQRARPGAPRRAQGDAQDPLPQAARADRTEPADGTRRTAGVPSLPPRKDGPGEG